MIYSCNKRVNISENDTSQSSYRSYKIEQGDTVIIRSWIKEVNQSIEMTIISDIEDGSYTILYEYMDVTADDAEYVYILDEDLQINEDSIGFTILYNENNDFWQIPLDDPIQMQRLNASSGGKTYNCQCSGITQANNEKCEMTNDQGKKKCLKKNCSAECNVICESGCDDDPGVKGPAVYIPYNLVSHIEEQ